MRTVPFTALTFASLALFCGCVHTPRGTSVQVALARKAELVKLPVPTVTLVAKTQSSAPSAGAESVPVEKTERVADAYSRGQFCMGVGKDEEAIAAFEEAVKIDPAFADAWQRLAALYEKTGQDKKAMEAFRKAKMVADVRSVR